MATAVAVTPMVRVEQGELWPVQSATEGAADVAGNTFVNTGKEFLVVRNSSGGGLTLDVKDSNGVSLPGGTFTVPAGASSVIGPFPVNVCSGTVTVIASAVTLKVLVFQLTHAGVIAL